MKVRASALLAAALTGVLASACAGKAPKQGPPPLAVDVSRATQRDIATYMSLDGQITPVLDSTLASPQSGTLAAVYANEGDRVTKGELLAQLDTSTLEAQLAANEATVAQSESRLHGTTVQAPINNQQYHSGLEQAKAKLASDEAQMHNAQTVYNSNAQLVKQGYVSQTAMEAARAAYVAAQQQISNDEAAVRAAETNLQSTAIDQTNIEQARATLAQAQANVKLLSTQIAQSAIHAPFDGVVTQRLLDPGAFAGPNQPIVRVSELDTVYVNANVPDESLSYVHPGTQASFVSASIPGRTFRGIVSDINAIPTQGTLSYRARMRQPNPDRSLRGGMLVTVTIQKQLHKNAVVVPRTAVFQSDQGASVFTVLDGKAKQLPVQVGLQTDTLSEVHGAISPGMVVITTRPDALQDGSVVAIGGATPAPAAPASKAP
ncbi:MAG TPA: efflux RND transporter periplasmic adaptor subunit [Candidatus Baltobacteraceae bacterium]|nr:efflux RND transporter periplasmic adaptor subunit [Candidatus Baltobacteraceae bacterium]